MSSKHVKYKSTSLHDFLAANLREKEPKLHERTIHESPHKDQYSVQGTSSVSRTIGIQLSDKSQRVFQSQNDKFANHIF